MVEGVGRVFMYINIYVIFECVYEYCVGGEGDYICVLYYCIYEFVCTIVLFIYRMSVYICAALYID